MLDNVALFYVICKEMEHAISCDNSDCNDEMSNENDRPPGMSKKMYAELEEMRAAEENKEVLMI